MTGSFKLDSSKYTGLEACVRPDAPIIITVEGLIDAVGIAGRLAISPGHRLMGSIAAAASFASNPYRYLTHCRRTRPPNLRHTNDNNDNTATMSGIGVCRMA
jgi:hypothetical protein